MPKDASYHEAAIQYNEELADFADALSDRIDHEVVQKWPRAVAKQHRFHAGRHRKALDKLKEREAGAEVNTEDGGEHVAVDDEQIVHRSAADGQFVTEDEAEANPDTTVRETVDTAPDTDVDTPASPDTAQDAPPIYNQGEATNG